MYLKIFYTLNIRLVCSVQKTNEVWVSETYFRVAFIKGSGTNPSRLLKETLPLSDDNANLSSPLLSTFPYFDLRPHFCVLAVIRGRSLAEAKATYHTLQPE